MDEHWSDNPVSDPVECSDPVSDPAECSNPVSDPIVIRTTAFF